jgi:hypothetical protein
MAAAKKTTAMTANTTASAARLRRTVVSDSSGAVEVLT